MCLSRYGAEGLGRGAIQQFKPCSICTIHSKHMDHQLKLFCIILGSINLLFPQYALRLRGFPGGASGKELTCQCKRHKRHGCDPWVRKIPWRRAWQTTPVFLPGEPHGQRSRAGYSPWVLKESDMTEHSSTSKLIAT